MVLLFEVTNSFPEEGDESFGAQQLSCSKQTQHDQLPFKFYSAISNAEIEKVVKFIKGGGLGPVPSSASFAYSEKCIRFLITVGKLFYSLSQDYFIQAASYNDFLVGTNGSIN